MGYFDLFNELHDVSDDYLKKHPNTKDYAIIYMYFDFPKVSVKVKFGGEWSAKDLELKEKMMGHKGFFYQSTQLYVPFMDKRIKIPSRLHYVVVTSENDFTFTKFSPKEVENKRMKGEFYEFLRYHGEDENGYHFYCGILSEEAQVDLSGQVIINPTDPKMIDIIENNDFWRLV
jgi:hypothetical protein